MRHANLKPHKNFSKEKNKTKPSLNGPWQLSTVSLMQPTINNNLVKQYTN